VVTPVGLSRRELSRRAWWFYGSPYGWDNRSNAGAVGEVRYVLGWVAEQVGRLEWKVLVDGKPVENDELIKQVANEYASVMIATNLLVAGELWYAAFDRSELDGLARDLNVAEGIRDMRQALRDLAFSLPRTETATWLPISTVFPTRDQVLGRAKLKARAVWSHPANPARPDPPLFGVLDVLEEIEQLQDLAYAQNNSRVIQLGFLEVAKEYSFIGEDNGSDFHTRMQAAIAARMADPRGTGGEPISVTAPGELVGKGIYHTKVEVDPDNQLEAKMRFAIQRLAFGFPVPPEILLGMTSTNRATAYQIEESTYKSHIEPVAKIVGRLYAVAAAQLIDGEDPIVEVIPDPTNLLARQSSVPDLQWAYIRGLINRAVVLRAMGINPDDPSTEATDEDIERLLLLNRNTRTGQRGDDAPEPDAADQPGITAAAALALESDVDLDELTARFSRIDEDLLLSLRTATARDVQVAFQRLGATCRSKLRQRGPEASDPYSAVTNAQLPLTLGTSGVRELGLDPEAALRGAFSDLVTWWRDSALPQAEEALRALVLPLGATLPPLNGQATTSADVLLQGLVTWGLEQLERDSTQLEEVPVLLLREVVATAGRG
jgi:hypothetical protein